MAKVIVRRDQQAEMLRRHPKPVYSRVINLTLQIAAGLGNTDYAVSPPIGGRVWLLNVTLSTMSQTRANPFAGFIYISTGTDKNVDDQVIAVKWEPCIRQYGGPKPAFYYSGFGDNYGWDMMKFFEGTGRRFGAMAANLSNTETWRAWISFQISEG